MLVYYKCISSGGSTWNQDQYERSHAPNVEIGKREIRFIKQKLMFLCHKLGGLAPPKQAEDIFLMLWHSVTSPGSALSYLFSSFPKSHTL